MSGSLALLSLVMAARVSCAQTFDATNLKKPADLSMNWRANAGDDPSWARPEFDDSAWMIVDPHKSLSEYFPKDHPEVVWYRLHVKVASGQTGLALEERDLARAFEIYAGGDRVLGAGSVSPYHPVVGDADLLVPLPARQIGVGSLVIALRMHISPREWPSVGLSPGNLTLGYEDALRDHIWLQLIGANAAVWLTVFLGLCVGMVASALYAAQRDRPEYLWVSLIALCGLATTGWNLLESTRNLPLGWSMAENAIGWAWFGFCSIGMYLAFLREQRKTWIAFVSGFGLGLGAHIVAVGGFTYDLMPSAAGLVLELPMMLVLYLAIPIVLVRHLRGGNREAGVLLIPVLFQGAWAYIWIASQLLMLIPRLRGTTSRILAAMTTFDAGPFHFTLADLSGALFWLSLGLILAWRTIRLSREQAKMESELEAARQVQQVIMAEETGEIPGFGIEILYRPAQQVGGDFYQVLPTAGGGFLLVLGDVAGKGMPAAMQVAVLVGAIRTLARFTSEPAKILSEMNERLLGRTDGGFSTCLAMHLSAGGKGTLANAGHLPPYLDGVELETTGALPLGIAPGQRYETREILLDAGSRLTFYSDGVVEAQNHRGEMMGFKRGRELSTHSANEIAAAACAYGQQDDITVIVIERQAVLATKA